MVPYSLMLAVLEGSAVAQKGLLRPGLSVVVDVDIRTSAEPSKTASINE